MTEKEFSKYQYGTINTQGSKRLVVGYRKSSESLLTIDLEGTRGWKDDLLGEGEVLDEKYKNSKYRFWYISPREFDEIKLATRNKEQIKAQLVI